MFYHVSYVLFISTLILSSIAFGIISWIGFANELFFYGGLGLFGTIGFAACAAQSLYHNSKDGE